jgi:Holliday junction resolvase RusA-like endonuclease
MIPRIWVPYEWEASIPILPIPKQSVKGGGMSFYTPPKEREYVAALTAEFQKIKPAFAFDGPLILVFCFEFPMTQGDMKKYEKGKLKAVEPKTTNPDVDNLEKPVQDALQKAGVIVNDSRISCKLSFKYVVPYSEGFVNVGLARFAWM